MFGLVIPGRPQTDLLQDPQNSYRWGVEVNTPASIGEFLVFLKTPMQIPNAGVGVYFSFPPFADYEFLGALDDSKPSDLFSTGWSLRPEVESCPAVRVCAMVEPAAELLEKLKTNPPKDVKLQYARCTALNLFRFIESFSQGQGAQATLTCPQDVLDRWLQRFEEKYKRDPNFVLRTE